MRLLNPPRYTRRQRLARWARFTANDIRYTLADVWSDYKALIGVVVATCIILAAIRAQAAPYSAQPAQPTPALPIIIATRQPEVQVVDDTRQRFTTAIIAYDAPGGAVIGPIEPGRAYAYAARSGDDWLQLDVADSGLVWIRATDLLGVPGNLADLRPSATPVPPAAAPTLAPHIDAAPTVAPLVQPQAIVAPTRSAEDAAFIASFGKPASNSAFVGCLSGNCNPSK